MKDIGTCTNAHTLAYTNAYTYAYTDTDTTRAGRMGRHQTLGASWIVGSNSYATVTLS